MRDPRGFWRTQPVDERSQIATPDGSAACPPARLELLDALRGFALLGIFLMNVEWFNRPLQLMGTGLDPAARGLDRVITWAIYALVQGKFWVLFSLLFGASFALMHERAARVGASAFAAAYWRRLAALAGFGIAHAVLLWPGDILLSYALAGVGLALMRDWPARMQRNLGLWLYAGLAGLLLLLAWQMLLPQAAQAFDSFLSGQRTQAVDAAATYAHGGWLRVTGQRWSDFRALAGGLWLQSLSALAVFPVGVWLLRSGRLRDPSAHRVWCLRTGAVCAACGLGLAGLAIAVQVRPVAPAPATVLLAEGLLFASGLPLAIAWLCGALLAWQSPHARVLLRVMAPAGRMALTNYLLQSAIASTVFYGYGLGWWGQWGRGAQSLFVLAVFAAQVAASRYWLSRWRYGPVEYLWRWITWRQRPAMRIAHKITP